MKNRHIDQAMTIKLSDQLPPDPVFDPTIRRAPKRELRLSTEQIELALKNALRYIPENLHDQVAPEFLQELLTRGRIYGYRYRPTQPIKGRPIDTYQGQTMEGRAFQVMIDNNLDPEVALYPYELVTYGETGQVCQNWMQYQLLKQYLEILTDQQTLVVSSGHPVGLFKSHPLAPRVIITNALMIGEFDDQDHWHQAMALGVANYGQMTAGGWMYIGPQGIVHGTYNTLLNAGRKELNIPTDGNLAGILFVSSGLGGMSGAQGKACKIAGGVGLIAEVDASRIQSRLDQGWIDYCENDVETVFQKVLQHQKNKEAVAIAYHGNIVDLLQYAVDHDISIDLLSDQTSCHAVYDGGYCPVSLSFEQRTNLLQTDKQQFIQEVNQSLSQHFKLIKQLVDKNTYFFDYGNAFMKSVYDAGETSIAKDINNPSAGFIFPSYVEDIMGPMLFDYGYGPFRWVCLSGKPEDLDLSDQAALSCIDPNGRFQDRDNYLWIKNAKANELVVGTQARILYQDAQGRINIALKFNEMVRQQKIGPIMLGRDHHDTGGTDSPYRETANIKDGSNIMADMATQSFAGNAARGMSLVALHNGGGVGIGKAINGGFGLLLDGSERVDDIIKSALSWDVLGGVARRAWARNPHSIETIIQHHHQSQDHITLPYIADDAMIQKLVADAATEKEND